MEKLEEKLKRMINKVEKDDTATLTQLELIDTVRIGTPFEEDLRKALDRISSLEGFNDSGLKAHMPPPLASDSLEKMAILTRLLKVDTFFG
ncbi:Terpene synthase, N-terminal domain containing protein [Parasponia andersonii]|uniref:Terpene synthase, N-terminal domain containing protein n=1 Tax=Parasponia andersonii TaxID=3476 RepID=A0A2P5BIG2_PARAD|nr:Terpene synthase, N-terminal domain containing protein [Parasponia andersonii]